MKKNLVFIVFLFIIGYNAASQDSIAYYSHLIEVDTFPLNKRKELLDRAINHSINVKNTYAELSYKFQKGVTLFDEGDYIGSIHLVEKTEKSIGDLIERFHSNDKKWIKLHIDILAQMSKAQVYLGLHDAGLSTCKKILELYGEDTLSIAAAKAYKGMGIVLSVRSFYKDAIGYFNKSLEISKLNKDEIGIWEAICNLGGAYLSIGKYQEGLSCFLEGQRYLIAQNKSGKELIHIYYYIGLAYKMMQKYELSEKYFLDAQTRAIENNMNHLLLYIRQSYAEILFEQNKYDKAKNESLSLLEELQKMNFQNMQIRTLDLLGKIYEKEGRLEKTIVYLHKSIDLRDSIYNSESNDKIITLKYQFENYKNIQKEKIKQVELELAQSNISKRNILLVFLSFIFILSIVAIFILTKKIYRQCHVNNLIKDQLSKVREGSQVKLDDLKQHLEVELNLKNKELVSNALLFLKFNELTLELIDKVKKLKGLFNLKREEKKVVAEMESLLKQFTPDQSWNEFKVYFEQTDKEFFTKLDLVCPNLTSNEKRLCALIRLNLNSKEIGTLTNRTFQSINTAKFRLKKKLNLDPEANLYNFFSEI